MIVLMLFKVLLPWLKVAFPDWCNRLGKLINASYWGRGAYVWCIAIIIFYCVGMVAIKKVKKFKVIKNLFMKHQDFFKKHNPYKVWSLLMLDALILALVFALGFKVLLHILLPVLGLVLAIAISIVSIVAFCLGIAVLVNWHKIQTEKMDLCKAWAFKHSNGTPYFCATALTKTFRALLKRVKITTIVVFILCIVLEILVGIML